MKWVGLAKKLWSNPLSRGEKIISKQILRSGSTVNEMLRALRVLNEDNTIAIFSLLGRKDLMVDSF